MTRSSSAVRESLCRADKPYSPGRRLLGRRLALFAAGALAAFAFAGKPAQAQEFPTRAITMVVPFAAGGPTDTVARLIAESMSKSLGQQVVVENVGGAGGTRGAGQVAKATPDGYTVLVHHIGQATSATLYRKLAYNVLTDFTEMGLITDVPMTMIAKKDFAPTSIPELIAYVKENKDKIVYGNAGVGSASHLCGMLFMSALDTQMTTVPYQGTGPAMNDLVGGQIDLMCDQTTNTTGQIKSGKVKAYGVTTPARVKSLPDLPTFDEAGLKGFEVAVWHGMYGPKGVPPEVVAKLNGALKAALQDPKVIARFADLGTEPVALDRATPEVHKAFVASEVAKWKPVIEKAGVFAD
ncbi:tripartite tricarboxylate transporter substrate binding protein BugD [Ancylobacter sp. 6x-1]|uniref:Tripartite tricarboxylate transporter substrate binding protein BugD n=1 Tax=Ancylobacter crimeensis TaxID=2579147 RepID=A0ABT0DA65_9HYPH|nr:tripartite tricarboxylate transporter substrate-binding protein [Ancylobacter crimeensis]MCK0196838.1 tripartite tricarboxylate transporter substrate binding protein BugD [Ancylobacter crimeensis]